MKRIRTVEKLWEEMKESDERFDENAKNRYSYTIIAEECDKLEKHRAIQYRYCPYLEAWRFVASGDVSTDETSSITGWRFAVYVNYEGQVVHCSGFIHKTFREAVASLPDCAMDIAWNKDLEGSAEHVAPFAKWEE